MPPAALNGEEKELYSALDQEIADACADGESAKVRELQEQQAQVGKANPLFLHSFSENAKPVYLHAQVPADFATIEQLIEVYIGIENRNPIPDLKDGNHGNLGPRKYDDVDSFVSEVHKLPSIS